MNQKIFHETKGSGPHLTLVHGWGFHSGIWQSLLPQLTPHFTVHLIDLPGFGRSAPLKNYSLEQIMDALLHVIPAKSIYLGWSLGGIITLALALRHPNTVEKSILVASSPRFVEDHDWPGMKSSLLNQFAHDLQQDYQATLNRFLSAQLRDAHLDKSQLSDIKKNLFAYGMPHADALIAGVNILKSTDLRKQISQLHSPQLYLLGRLDTMVPAPVAESIQALTSHAQCIVMQKAGHIPFLSHAGEFLNYLLEFTSHNKQGMVNI